MARASYTYRNMLLTVAWKSQTLWFSLMVELKTLPSFAAAVQANYIWAWKAALASLGRWPCHLLSRWYEGCPLGGPYTPSSYRLLFNHF
jgi:hypothetical protein